MANAGLEDYSAYELAMDPQTPSTIYAGTNEGGVFKSLDGGQSWTAANIDPHHPGTIYAGAREGGVFRSADGGTTWEATSRSSIGLLFIYDLVMDSQEPATLYAGSGGGGVYKSEDGGMTWSEANSGLSNTSVSCLAIQPNTPGTLFAGTYGGGVFRTTDGGNDWTEVNTGLSNLTINALAADPLNASVAFAATWGGGVFKSLDGGSSWQSCNTGLLNTYAFALAIDPNNSDIVFAGMNDGVYKSQDGGASWAKVTDYYGNSIAFDPFDSNIIYMAGWGLFRSGDGGASWDGLNDGLPGSVLVKILASPDIPTTYYLGTWNGIYSMTYAGVSPPETSITSAQCGTMITSNSTTFTWTGTENGGQTADLIYAYRLDGGTWSAFGPETSKSYTDLSNGFHLFEVTSRDQLGNEDPTPASCEVQVNSNPPVISGMAKSGSPFRININGTNLQSGIRVFINGNEWTDIKFKSSTLIKLKGGSSLKALVPKYTETTFRFLNPDGGEASLIWQWP